MKKIIVSVLSLMLCLSAFAQEKERRDTVPLQKKTRQPPDSLFTNPIYQGPAEIDSINRTDSLKGGRRSPIERYKEDSIPKSPKRKQ